MRCGKIVLVYFQVLYNEKIVGLSLKIGETLIMTSSFAGWSAHQIIGTLNRNEVRAALLEFKMEKSSFRTWDTIEKMILESSDDVKRVLYECGVTKANVERQHQISGLKQHREAMAMARNIRRHIGDYLSSFHIKKKRERINDNSDDDETKRDFSMFMQIPNEEQAHQCYKAFYDATSNTALRFQICPVCAQEKLACEGDRTSLLSDPSMKALLVDPRSTGHDRSNMLILDNFVERQGEHVNCWMCLDCKRALERSMLPKFSLANNLFIGEIPYQLRGLTIPEQLLIARHYPRCYIFKLYPRDYDGRLPSNQMYNRMAGNASLFELNTQEIVKMLRGQKLPSPVASLASIVAMTFIGSKQLPMDWVKKTFRVR